MTVAPGTPIAGVQFDLSYDSSLLAVTSVTEGNLLNQGGATTYFQPGTINNTTGETINVAGAITTPGDSVSGQGVFATVYFQALASGTSPITLSDVIAGNTAGQAVPVQVNSGSVTVQGATITAAATDGSGVTATCQVTVTAGGSTYSIYDVNEDGQVNVLDLQLVAQHFTS